MATGTCPDCNRPHVALFRCTKCGHVQGTWIPCQNGSCNGCGSSLKSA
jgi:hypothetical protein